LFEQADSFLPPKKSEILLPTSIDPQLGQLARSGFELESAPRSMLSN
jgi:hypothetical protein